MNSMFKCLVNVPGLMVAVLSCVLPQSAQASGLPNLVHYINNAAPIASPAPGLAIPDTNFSDKVSLDWPSFGGEGYVYYLEYSPLDSEDWQLLYQGGQSYFISPDDFPSGSYRFRLTCSGIAGCPAEGYLVDTMEVIQKTGFVNAEYDHASDMVHVYWGETQNTQGYVLEQSSDGGNSWQEVSPQGHEKLAYQGDNYSGELHTRTSVLIPGNEGSSAEVSQTIQGVKRVGSSTQLKSKLVSSGQTVIKTNPSYQSGTSFQYRVKTCVENFCGNSTLSQLLTIGELTPVLTDPGFENQNDASILLTQEYGASLAIDSVNPISGNNSLSAKLSNYGFTYYVHNYNDIHGGNVSDFPILNGVTISGKLRINKLDKGNSLSVYPVAYYEGYDRRIEGQKQTFTSVDIGQDLDLFGRLWLDDEPLETNRIKRIYFKVRLIGSGQADITLDDVQLYEGSGLAQTDPTLSAWLSNYSGVGIHLNWPAFLNAGARYRLEYKEQKQNEWQLLYQGPETDYVDAAAEPWSTGVYQFRLFCGSPNIGSCPESGYVEATTVIAREPAYISVKTDAGKGTTLLDWEDTVSAYGYVLQKSSNNGSSWTEMKPDSSDAQRAYTAADGSYSGILFVDAGKELTGLVASTDLFRVKACRSSGCGEWRTSTGVYNVNDRPLEVPGFAVDKTSINPGETINIWWDRPANYSKDFSYRIYVTKFDTEGNPEGPWVWAGADGELTGHNIARGEGTGIQRNGTQVLEIEACLGDICSEQRSRLTVTVDGPPPKPWDFTVNKPVISLGNTVTLSWQMHHNYLLPVTYKLYVKKPDSTSLYEIPGYTGGESYDRFINKVGEHIFYVKACHDTDGCGDYSSVTVDVGDIPVYQSGSKLYLKVPQGNDEKLLELVPVDNDWQVNELTLTQWNVIAPESLLVSQYQVLMGDFDGNGADDFKVVSGDQTVEIFIFSPSVLFIKTELLGAPVIR